MKKTCGQCKYFDEYGCCSCPVPAWIYDLLSKLPTIAKDSHLAEHCDYFKKPDCCRFSIENWQEEDYFVCSIYDDEGNEIVRMYKATEEEAILCAKKMFNSIIKREYFPIE